MKRKYYYGDNRPKTPTLLIGRMELIQHPNNNNQWAWYGRTWRTTEDIFNEARECGLAVNRGEI